MYLIVLYCFPCEHLFRCFDVTFQFSFQNERKAVQKLLAQNLIEKKDDSLKR